MKKIIIVFAFAAGLWGLLLPVAQAANIVDVNFPCPGGNIPGFPECERIPDGEVTNDFVGYVLQAYQFGIGIVGIIAVGMIVYGGILIAWNTESIDKKGKGREMITSALTGIAVLFGSYLLLKTINPELVKFNLITNIPAQCSDGRDNDKDGQTDYPKDTDCSSAEDATERAGSDTINEALNSLKTLCGDGGDPTTIGRIPSVVESPNCEYRKMTYKGSANLKIGDDGKYYNEWGEEEIVPNSMIWSYPYYITSEGTSTAKCLIYAYKNLNTKDSSIVKIDLDDELSMCSLDPNKKLKNEDDAASDGCSDCIELKKNSSVVVKSGICSSNGGVCLINRDMHWKLDSLAKAITGWQITEAYPPTYTHQSSCHLKGTCVDANFIPGITGYSDSDINKIKNFIAEAKRTGLRPVYEIKDQAIAQNVRGRMGLAGNDYSVIHVEKITADHFSLYNN